MRSSKSWRLTHSFRCGAGGRRGTLPLTGHGRGKRRGGVAPLSPSLPPTLSPSFSRYQLSFSHARPSPHATQPDRQCKRRTRSLWRTLNTQHSTLNTRHSTLNTQHSTLNPTGSARGVFRASAEEARAPWGPGRREVTPLQESHHLLTTPLHRES